MADGADLPAPRPGHRLLGVAGHDDGRLRGAGPAASLRPRGRRRRTTCPAAVAALRGADAGGANVTVPHKAAVAALVDELSDVAREADAVNIVVRDGDRLVGHNTDLPATIDAAAAALPGRRRPRRRPRGRRRGPCRAAGAGRGRAPSAVQRPAPLGRLDGPPGRRAGRGRPARQRHARGHRQRREPGAGGAAAPRPRRPRPRLPAQPDAPRPRGPGRGRAAQRRVPASCSARPGGRWSCGWAGRRRSRPCARPSTRSSEAGSDA